ncbi:hypothetical protein [Dyadobacter psychrotolerans]|uniref:DUF2780 domain-containing protein n=1 Tax=Dyadobacter psychrotolerans TaxID=2541721 RepID=A0A4R5DAB6_9BACT|nr:hypothetical protein [Dyadobacter psychrotolerans]TDE10529.1 hypothetical protein E0F88_28010 [Dyadobacter psychrotolerans]
MKSYILSFATVFCLFICGANSFGQSLSVENLLDKAVTLSQKGDSTGATEALTKGTSALETEAKSAGGSLKDKLLSQAGNLKSLIPLASSGKLSSGVLGKAVSAVKMLVGANRISSLLGKGESGLLGNAANLTNNLGLIKAGSSILGSESQSQLGGLLGEATKAVSGLDKKGVTGKLAATASSKSLGTIVKLVGSAL